MKGMCSGIAPHRETKTQWHELKCLPQHYIDASLGVKPYEVRLNDRDFKKGDYILLREYDGNHHTGREDVFRVTHVLAGFEGLKEGYVILSLNEVIDRRIA